MKKKYQSRCENSRCEVITIRVSREQKDAIKAMACGSVSTYLIDLHEKNIDLKVILKAGL